MGLLVYSAANPSSAFSTGGLFTNPLVKTFDGVTGNTVDTRYYVRNDSSARSYSGIVVAPRLGGGDNIFDGTNGFIWKMIVGDTQPLDAQWDLVSAANSIVIPDIGTPSVGDTTTFEPFWLRMIVPRGASIKSYSGVILDITGTETIIP